MKMSSLALGKIRLATKRSSFVENKRRKIAYNTFRWTLVALINRTLSSLRQLSILCFDGIKGRQNATCALWMYHHLAIKHGKPLFGTVNGLPEGGRFKNLLLR
jgi:hypothetical protein